MIALRIPVGITLYHDVFTVVRHEICSALDLHANVCLHYSPFNHTRRGSKEEFFRCVIHNTKAKALTGFPYLSLTLRRKSWPPGSLHRDQVAPYTNSDHDHGGLQTATICCWTSVIQVYSVAMLMSQKIAWGKIRGYSANCISWLILKLKYSGPGCE